MFLAIYESSPSHSSIFHLFVLWRSVLSADDTKACWRDSMTLGLWKLWFAEPSICNRQNIVAGNVWPCSVMHCGGLGLGTRFTSCSWWSLWYAIHMTISFSSIWIVYHAIAYSRNNFMLYCVVFLVCKKYFPETKYEWLVSPYHPRLLGLTWWAGFGDHQV